MKRIADATLTQLLQIVAGRSPGVADRARAAIRAHHADSPALQRRVTDVLWATLGDADAQWTEGERVQLTEWAALLESQPDDLSADDQDARHRLSGFVAASGLSQSECARLLGRDPRSVRRWLGGQQPIPRALADQIERLRVTRVESGAATLIYKRV